MENTRDPNNKTIIFMATTIMVFNAGDVEPKTTPTDPIVTQNEIKFFAPLYHFPAPGIGVLMEQCRRRMRARAIKTIGLKLTNLQV